MNKIKRIHNNFDSLCDNYSTFPETEAVYEAIEGFIEENGLLGDTEYRRQLYKLITDYGAKNEIQGFVYGFKYAFSLFLDTVED